MSHKYGIENRFQVIEIKGEECMNSFLRGTIILAGAAFISECIEFLINLTLAKELGEYGIGQYMTVIPVIGLLMIIASFELDISVSKFVAEREEKYHLTLLRFAMKLTFLIMTVLLTGVAIMFIFFPLFSEIHPAIRWLILILIPILTVASIARGYFMGIQKMSKIATANLFRRGTHLFLLVLLFQLFDFELEMSILVALCAIIGSELLVLIYLMSAYLMQIKYLKSRPVERISKNKILRSLMEVSLPTTAMRIFYAVTHAIQPFFIKFILVSAGLSMNEATEHFGMVTGVAMTIGFFPAFIAHSLNTALIPNVSNAFVNTDQSRLVRLLRQVIGLTMLYGVPVCFLFYYFANPLTSMFVKSSMASYYLQLMWPYFLLHYFTIPLQAFLIGMGMVKHAFIHNIWATVVTFVIMYLFGSSSVFQMDGVILGLNTGAMVLMLLHYFVVCKKIGISLTLSKKEPMYYE